MSMTSMYKTTNKAVPTSACTITSDKENNHIIYRRVYILSFKSWNLIDLFLYNNQYKSWAVGIQKSHHRSAATIVQLWHEPW